MKKLFLSLLLLLPMVVMSQTMIADSVDNQEIPERTYLYRQGKMYYYQDMSMKEKEMAKFLKNNCTKAYKYYRRNQQVEYAGWGILSGGICIAGIGGALLGGGVKNQNPLEAFTGVLPIFVGGGLSCFVAVPMIVCGNVKKKNAHKKFNESCAPKKTASVTLNLQSSRNGLGLALCF